MNLLKRSGRLFLPRGIRNWLRSPSRTARWMWNELQFGIGITKTIEMRPEWRVVCHPSALDFAYFAQQKDAEQVAEFDGFLRSCRPGMTLFDLGAHFGLFSLAALHYGGADSRAVAVDPSPTACRITSIQAQLNRVADRLRIVRACASDCTGWREMVDSGVQSGSYFVSPGRDHTSGELTRTRSTTIDALVAQFKFQPTHIKIDVEGYEEAVLRGGSRTLGRADGPLLFVELHNEMVSNRGGNPSDALGLLRQLGYETLSPACVPMDHSSILATPLIRVIARKRAIENSSRVA